MSNGSLLEKQSPPDSARNNNFRKIVTAVIITALLGTAAGSYTYFRNSSRKEPPKLKVGVMMALSGGSSNMGYGVMKGVLLAKKELSANNIEIVQADSKCDAKVAVSAIKRLVEQHVVAIVGEGCSNAAEAVLPIVNNNKIVMISPSADSPTLSIADDYFFRVVPPNTFHGAFLAKIMYSRGIKRVGVFYTNEPGIMGLGAAFEKKFKALGGKVVASASAEPDSINLHNQVQTLKSASPQAILITPSSVVSATAFAQLLSDTGANIALYGADIMYDDAILENAGKAIEGMTISTFPTGNNPFHQSSVNEYQTNEQLYAAPQAYDIIQLLHLAIQQGAITAEEIKNFLSDVELNGKSGRIIFDKNGEVSGENYIYDLFKIKDGSFVDVEDE